MSEAGNSTQKSKRPLVFLAVGIGNTLLDFAFYILLTQVFLRGEENIALAGIISGTFALICAFLTHGLITWRGKEVSHRTAFKFFVFTGFGMWVIRPLLLALFIKLGGLYDWAHSVSQSLSLPFSREFIASTGAFGFMVIIVLIYNYVVYNRFVFNKPKTTSAPSGRDDE
jgi:putative flippase GtrA